MNGYAHFFCDFFTDLGLPDGVVTFMNMLCMFIILALLIYIADFLTRKILLRAFTNFSNRSKTKFDDFLVSNKVPRNIAHLVPLFLTFQLFPIVFYDYPQFENFIIILLKIYAVFLFTWIFRSILKALESYFKTLPRLQDKPIDSYIQVVMLFVWAIGFGLCFVILTGIPLWTFFTTLGAASAILLLVFKDTILGLVASI